MMNSINKKKPFDIGNGIISSSVSNIGKIISINTAHKEHGYIKLTPVKAFSNSDWYKPEQVRAYRNSFLSKQTEKNGYSLIFDLEKINKSPNKEPISFYKNTNILISKESYDDFIVKKFIFIPPEKSFLIYLYELENLSSNKAYLPFTVSGDYGITRASYGQITENGPIPMPQIRNIIQKVTSTQLVITESGTQSNSFLQICGLSSPQHYNLTVFVNKICYFFISKSFDSREFELFC